MAGKRVIVAIPVRMNASRLPGKPLVDLGGRFLVLRVVECVLACAAVDQCVVITDDERVRDVVASAGFSVLYDPRRARTGSDRIAAALPELDGALDEDGVVVNVQGDQPDLDPAALAALIAHMHAHPSCGMATLSAPLLGPAEDRARVKVVVDHAGRALYFSRSPIPVGGPHRVHLGIYAFRPSILRTMASLPTGTLEASESLEQLRLLEHGVPIDVLPWPRAWSSIDLPEDVTRWTRARAAVG